MGYRVKHIAQRIAAILTWVAVWFVAARFVDNPLLLPGPLEAACALGANLASVAFWETVASSGARIVGVSASCAVLGTAMGLAAARFRAVELLAAPLIQVMKSAPVACVVVILLVALGSRGAIAAIVAFVALPPFYVAALESARSLDRQAARTLELLGATKLQVFLALSWPASLPMFQAAAKTSMALSWRAGVTGELLGVPLGSIGAAVYASKLTLDAAGLLSWTAVVMLCGWLCERLAVALIRCTGRSPELALLLARRRVGRRSKPASCGGAHWRTASEGGPRCLGQHGFPYALSVRGVSKSLGGRNVLSDVSLEVVPGDRVCVMAPTGTGKTTLLDVLMGFSVPDGGEVACPRPCGAVRQRPCLVEGLTPLQNALLVASPAVSEKTLSSALADLLPPGAHSKKAAELSGGTRRLAEIARAVFSDGCAIILDEPFAGLDAAAKERACSLVIENLHDRPLVVATHDERDAALLGARIVRLP